MTPPRRPTRPAQQARPTRRAPWPGLHVERLEDRLAPAAGLPPDLVVGRTLSAYSTADVPDHTLRVTYTVYNEQADDLNGVLLTDTLQPGVAFTAATLLPDRSGQNLAWSLGTIPGYGRAAVTLTLTSPDALPLRIDAGAKAFGTLNAGAVVADTPPAALVSRPLPAASLASTPDANTTDPFVQEQAAKLRYDPQAIFDYLNAAVGYESYVGSLRGARGALWSAAGNSLDEASLGVALMRASGLPARYAHGTLPDALSKRLILSMFPASYQTVGYVPAGVATADPANDPKLLAETRDHYWLQVDTGDGFRDADTSGLGGTAIGAAYTTAIDTFTEVADALRHKVEVKLDAETFSQADAAFVPGSDGLSTATVLDRTFNSVDLVGRPLTVGQFVNQSSAGALAFSSRTSTYTPYLVVGDDSEANQSSNQTYTGAAFQEIATNFPLGSRAVTGVVLHLTLSGPGAGPEVFDHTVLDRIGYAARQGLAVSQLAIDPAGPPALDESDVTVVAASASLQSLRVAKPLANRLSEVQSQINQLSNGGQSPPDTSHFATLVRELSAGFVRLVGNSVLTYSDGLTTEFASADNVSAYFDRPRLVVTSQRVVSGTDGSPSAARVSLDLLRDRIRAVARPGQATHSTFDFGVARGLIENGVESAVAAAANPTGTSVSTTRVFAAAAAQGVPLALLTDPGDAARLPAFGLGQDAAARITAALQAGRVVIVPQSPVSVGGR